MDQQQKLLLECLKAKNMETPKCKELFDQLKLKFKEEYTWMLWI
jgi:hypothetical protein